MNKACTVVPQAVMHMGGSNSNSQTSQTAQPLCPARIRRADVLLTSRIRVAWLLISMCALTAGCVL